MPQIGEIKRAKEIGYRGYNEYFVWTACPNCGRERWVRRGKAELQTFTGWCQTCSARRNNKMRVYSKSGGSLAWKGGRTIDHGYVLVLLQPDDFFYPMTNAKGYVREHRLVVAKALNRCLLPWEVVHHKGTKYPLGSVENKQDNRYPENLELLGSSGKHNKEVERLIKQARDEGFKAGEQAEKERSSVALAESYFRGRQDRLVILDANIEEAHKAGERRGMTDKIGVLNAEYRAGKKAGIREVVESVRKLWKPQHHNLCYGVIDPHPDCICCKWQAKLKEWGINVS